MRATKSLDIVVYACLRVWRSGTGQRTRDFTCYIKALWRHKTNVSEVMPISNITIVLILKDLFHNTVNNIPFLPNEMSDQGERIFRGRVRLLHLAESESPLHSTTVWSGQPSVSSGGSNCDGGPGGRSSSSGQGWWSRLLFLRIYIPAFSTIALSIKMHRAIAAGPESRYTSAPATAIAYLTVIITLVTSSRVVWIWKVVQKRNLMRKTLNVHLSFTVTFWK